MPSPFSLSSARPITLCCFTLVSLLLNQGWSRELPKNAPPVVSGPSSSSGPDAYLLGVGDELNVWVAQLDQSAGKAYTIDHGGCITLPVAGRVHVQGLTISQAEVAVRVALQRYVRDPEVGVSLAETKNEGVSILGAVGHSGVFQLSQGKTLVDMLMLAGGISSNAGPFAIIMRPVTSGPLPLADTYEDPTGRNRLAQVDVRQVMALQKSSENITLLPGDTISVPEARMVYVVGEVTKPGAFPLVDEQETTALKVLAMAGGPLKGAAPENARIVRSTAAGQKPQLIAVNMKRLLKGKAEDFQMKPNDILFVPNSTQKAITSRALDAAIQTAIFAITYGGLIP